MDLHEQLLAAVNARLEVARAVIAFEPYDATISADSKALCDALAALLVANDPATVIRHCERDLRVLERHAPVHLGGPTPDCKHAWADSDGWIEDYPCEAIRDLAAAYGVEVDDA